LVQIHVKDYQIDTQTSEIKICIICLHVMLSLMITIKDIHHCKETDHVYARDVEAAISSTASAPIASASNITWTLTEPGLYLIYELADKHDYQHQQLTIYKGTLLVKMIA